MVKRLLVTGFAVLMWHVASAVDITVNSVIVVDAEAPAATRLAVDELNDFIGQILGSSLTVVNSHPAGKTAIVLGAAARRRLGEALSTERDRFVVEATDDAICIFGNDDDFDEVSKLHAAEAQEWQSAFRRGTLFGVYEFLEQQAGVRMYFPGELGTVVTPMSVISMTADRRISQAPVCSVRRYGYNDFRYGYPPMDLMREFDYDITAIKRLNWYRLRMETEHLMANHNPCLPENHCLAAETWESCLYTNACAFFRERTRNPAPLRMSTEAYAGRVYKLTPCDGFTMPKYTCTCTFCTNIREILRKEVGGGTGWKAKVERNFSTREVWRRTVELANKISAAHPEALFSQLAYMSYADVEQVDVDIPTNVLVFVARRGPWAQGSPVQVAETNDVRAWHDKIGRKVSLWNYPGKRQGTSIPNLDTPGIPQMAPHAWADYYQSVAPWINGAFAECESDRWIYNYLNLYVFSRIMWNPAVDVDDILDEHHEKMFGAGADDMKNFFDMLEDCWMQVVTDQVVTNTSSVFCNVPSPEELRRTIYSPMVLAGLDHNLRAASNRVAYGSIEERRIAFFRRRFFEPLCTAMKVEEYPAPIERVGLVHSLDNASECAFCTFRQADRIATTNVVGSIFLCDTYHDRQVLRRYDTTTGLLVATTEQPLDGVTVRFYNNASASDETYREATVLVGRPLGALSAPDASSTLHFGGWYTSRDDFSPVNRVNESTIVGAGGLSVYARWYRAFKSEMNTCGYAYPNGPGFTSYTTPSSPFTQQKWFGVKTGGDPCPGSTVHTNYVRSGVIGAGESVAMNHVIANSVGVCNDYEISFDWYVSSESHGDALVFEVDGTEYARLSGTNQGWQSFCVLVRGAFAHTNTWRYVKDSRNVSGLDAGFVDNMLIRIPVAFDSNGGPIQSFERYYTFGYSGSRANAAYAKKAEDGFPENSYGTPDFSQYDGFEGWWCGTNRVYGSFVVSNAVRTLRAKWASPYRTWAGSQGLSGSAAAWNAQPDCWGGRWCNAFVYTYGEKLLYPDNPLLRISFDDANRPVITTAPIEYGRTEFRPTVIGSPSVNVWASPVTLENSGDDWTLPAEAEANFFRVRLKHD